MTLNLVPVKSFHVPIASLLSKTVDATMTSDPIALAYLDRAASTAIVPPYE